MVDLQKLAPSLKRRFLKLFGSRIEVIWLPTSQLEPVAGELAWVEDSLFEIAVRARNAVPFGGRLVIEWANIHLDDTTAPSQGLEAGQYVMLEMTCLRQDPSQPSSCDADSPSSALRDSWLHCDFANAQAMIRSLGGQICEYNEPGRALTIRAFFPVASDALNDVQEYHVTEELNRCRILLVEDEGYVRDVACEILESQGYHVVTARSPKEALEIFEQNRPVQLLLTDVIMPGMNGQDLSQHLTSLDPELKTIYMSGYTEGFGPRTHRPERMIPFLQKPFTLESLTEKVKQVLSSDAF